MQFEAKIFLYIFVHIAQKMLIGIDFHLKKLYWKNYDPSQIPPMAEKSL